MKYMVITKIPARKRKYTRGKTYAGSWHNSYKEALKFGKSLHTKFIITTKPKKHYNF